LNIDSQNFIFFYENVRKREIEDVQQKGAG